MYTMSLILMNITVGFKESVKLCACDLQKTFSLIFAVICSRAPVHQQGFLH